MDIQIKKLKESDYEIIVDWWKDWGWPPVPKDFLPENGTGGAMIYIDQKPVCAGFVYTTNSKVFWLDWIISDKQYHEAGRKKAIETLLHTLSLWCEGAGAKYIYALLKSDSLIKKYESLGFVQGDSYTKEMIKKL